MREVGGLTFTAELGVSQVTLGRVDAGSLGLGQVVVEGGLGCVGLRYLRGGLRGGGLGGLGGLVGGQLGLRGGLRKGLLERSDAPLQGGLNRRDGCLGGSGGLGPGCLGDTVNSGGRVHPRGDGGDSGRQGVDAAVDLRVGRLHLVLGGVGRQVRRLPATAELGLDEGLLRGICRSRLGARKRRPGGFRDGVNALTEGSVTRNPRTLSG